MRQKIEYKQGDKVGNCIFIEELPTKIIGQGKNKTIRRTAKFQCKCGNMFECILLAVKYGNTKSCGCDQIEKIRNIGKTVNKTHGKRNHLLYKTWSNMIRRCDDSKNMAYHNYGGRGIKVCEEWYNINNFISDMYPSYKEGLELDRKHVDEGYNKENCRWVTRKQNMNNIRRNRIIEYNGQRKTMSDWADYLKIPYTKFRYKVYTGRTEEIFKNYNTI